MITADTAGELLAAFTTVFFIFAVGFGVQRLRPFSEETLNQLSWLVVNILLPIFLFYATATGTTPAELAAAPLLILVAVVIPLVGLLLAVIVGSLAHVQPSQMPAFRFSAMVGNTAFIGIPLCAGLFGTSGAVYAVLYDFGTTLILFTVGIWVLTGGHRADWRALVGNPLFLSVVAGLAWALVGWELPAWLTSPCATLGDATLPIALVVGGAQLGNIRSSIGRQWRPVAALAAIQLVVVPLIAAAAMRLLSPDAVFAGVVVVEAATPVGLTSAIMSRSYGADASLASAAILWSTMAMVVTLPVLVGLLL